jgi:hypothetical protein
MMTDLLSKCDAQPWLDTNFCFTRERRKYSFHGDGTYMFSWRVLPGDSML